MNHPELLSILQQTLDALDITNTRQGDEVALPDGLLLKPQLIDLHERENGGFHTATTVTIRHPTLFAGTIFEYQYAVDATWEEALASGFQSWAQLDLVTLRDAVLDEPENCLVMTTRYRDDGESGEEHVRQILFGPTAQYHDGPETTEEEQEEHPFCLCCLFTNSIEAFSDLLKSKAFLGVRLYAARDTEGHCQADCRVNGQEFQAAQPLLCAYTENWPQAGFEYRKQYVVIRNKP